MAAKKTSAATKAQTTPPRPGKLTWLTPPGGGGRDFIGVPLGSHVAAAGDRAVALQGHCLTAIDLRTGASEPVARLAFVDEYRSVAIAPDGTWAASDGVRCFRNGKDTGVALHTLVFDASGSLWGFDRSKMLVRIDPDGTTTKHVTAWSGPLAVAGNFPVIASYGSLHVPDGDAGFDTLSSSIKNVPGTLLAGASHIVATFWLQREESYRWSVAVWDRAARTERVVDLPSYDGHGLIVGDRLVWSNGSLDLATLAVDAIERPKFGPRHGQAPRVGAVTLSPDGSELRHVIVEHSVIRRFRLSDHQEIVRGSAGDAGGFLALSVTNDGRVATANEDGFEVRAADGRLLHRNTDGEAGDVAFSPDGGILAVRVASTVHVLDGATFEALAETEAGEGALALSPDGKHLLTADGKVATIRDARTLAPLALLPARSTIEGVHFSSGSVVAHDGDERVYVFDDLGSLAPSRKPPKLSPNAAISIKAEGFGTMIVERLGDELMIAMDTGVRLFPFGSKKARLKSERAARLSRQGAVLALDRGDGSAALIRCGEADPFASLPDTPALHEATPDGRRVVAEVFGGIVLWSDEGSEPWERPASPAQLPRE